MQMHRMDKLDLLYLTLETENKMKNQFLLLFLFFCFLCFGQETNSKSTALNGNTNTENVKEFSNASGGKNDLGLKDRHLEGRGAIKVECNDEGTIVVEVEVNQSGIVTNAKFSPRDSTTTSKCLQEVAIKASYKYKWNEDLKAPENQIGFLMFNFKGAE